MPGLLLPRIAEFNETKEALVPLKQGVSRWSDVLQDQTIAGLQTRYLSGKAGSTFVAGAGTVNLQVPNSRQQSLINNTYGKITVGACNIKMYHALQDRQCVH